MLLKLKDRIASHILMYVFGRCALLHNKDAYDWKIAKWAKKTRSAYWNSGATYRQQKAVDRFKDKIKRLSDEELQELKEVLSEELYDKGES